MKRVILFFAAAIGLLTACVNDELQEANVANDLLSDVATQVEAVMTSAEDVKALNEALGKYNVNVDEAAEAVSLQLALLKDAVSLQTGALSALDQQKSIASVVGVVEASLLSAEGYNKELKALFESLHASVSSWLGDSFNAYYPVMLAQVKVDAVLAGLNPQICDQQLYVSAILSDIEAGLRNDGNPEELNALAASVEKASLTAETLSSSISTIAAEVEKEYKAAIRAMSSDSASFNKETLVELNASALTKAGAATPTLTELAASVKECQTTLEDLQNRLGKVEGDVQDLLGLIQSLTFVSEYSDDKAIAYYSMTDKVNAERAGEGKMERVPESSFNLTYLVRPAAAADALAESWQESNCLNVIGYYANVIEQAAVNFIPFEINSVTSTHGKGLLTVNVKNAFSDDFYFKEIGARLALAVEYGQNNCTSKFVEIVPKDASGKVYAESLTLTPTTLSIQNGDTYQLSAVVSPANVTDKGCTWEDYDSEYISVNENGKLTATAVGRSQVLVAANATDEFGRKLTATCDVNVEPAVRIHGPNALEVGQTAVLEIESPEYIIPSTITWELEYAGNANYLGLTKNDDGTCSIAGYLFKFGKEPGASDGAKSYYQPINVKCTIAGSTPTVLVHTVTVVAAQPKAIAIEGLAYDQSKLTLKKGETFQLNSSLQPEGVNADYFSLIYQTNASYIASVDFRSGLVKGEGYGTAHIDVKVSDKTNETYVYPKNNYFTRTLAVTVEPYWVKTMTLPETYKMAPEATAALTPEWTSDVDGVAPSDQKLVWTSSNPSVVSVNETTGEMIAHKEGNATITATTAGSNAVPSGSAQISSSCFVTVETPTVPVNVGDFYYSDGTWSTTLDRSKTVIGVVFAKVDATAADLKLRNDYPNASHGLIVSISEYSENMGYLSNAGGSTDSGKVMAANGYDIFNMTIPNGYTNTFGLTEYGDAEGFVSTYNAYYAELFTTSYGVLAKHNVNVPEGASSWYIPSYYEMSLMKENITVLNNALNAAGGDDLSGVYWTSTFKEYYRWNAGQGSLDATAGYDISNGSWVTYVSNGYSQINPVRVVLAF